MGTNSKMPLWVYDEKGIEIPFAVKPDEWETELDIDPDTWDEIAVTLTPKQKRQIKWQFLKLAIKFLFMRW